MDLKRILESQYLAAPGDVDKRRFRKCPPAVWNDPQDKDAFWFVAYQQALRYAHQYLNPGEKGYPRSEQRLHLQPGYAVRERGNPGQAEYG